MMTDLTLLPGAAFSGDFALQDAMAAVARFRRFPVNHIVLDGAVFVIETHGGLRFIGFAGPYDDLVTGWREPIVVRDDDGNPVAVVDPWDAHRRGEQRRDLSERCDASDELSECSS